MKFNPDKSQLIIFGGRNPFSSKLYINGSPLMWVEKVKYLGSWYLIFTHSHRDQTDRATYEKFYGQFNIIISAGQIPT